MSDEESNADVGTWRQGSGAGAIEEQIYAMQSQIIAWRTKSEKEEKLWLNTLELLRQLLRQNEEKSRLDRVELLRHLERRFGEIEQESRACHKKQMAAIGTAQIIGIIACCLILIFFIPRFL